MAMSELGAFLRRHRDERGWSLDEVESRTRIRRRYLELMEAGDWDELPPSVYTRGLLRNYARALGVSPNSVLRMYVKERPGEARLPEPQLLSRPLIEEPRLNLELVTALVVLAVAVAAFTWLVGTQFGGLLEARGNGGGSPSASVGPAAAATSDGDVGTAAPLAEATETGTPPSSMTARPLATETPAPSPTPTGLVLEIEALGDIWLRVYTDGEQAYEGFLTESDTRRWEAAESVRVRTGDAGVTSITLNGQPIAPLGDRGDVEETRWRLLPSGDIQQEEL